MRNFKINARNKLTIRRLLTFSTYTRPHLEYGSSTYVKNVALGTLLRFEAPGDLPVDKVKMQQLTSS